MGITSDYYVRPQGDRDEKTAEMMDDAIAKASGTA